MTEQWVRKDNIKDEILHDFRTVYCDERITKLDIFYYIYGVLSSPEYKTRFNEVLKKMLPRIPYTGSFWDFSLAGRELSYWHIEYENVEPYPLTEVSNEMTIEPKEYYRVTKMKFGRKDKKEDKTTIIYNSRISLSNIPLETYEYIVNGKSALEWIMERYQVTTNKDSGIKNDPNDWSDDPEYILNLVKRIVRVSLETNRIVNALPSLNIRNQEENFIPQQEFFIKSQKNVYTFIEQKQKDDIVKKHTRSKKQMKAELFYVININGKKYTINIDDIISLELDDDNNLCVYLKNKYRPYSFVNAKAIYDFLLDHIAFDGYVNEVNFEPDEQGKTIAIITPDPKMIREANDILLLHKQ